MPAAIARVSLFDTLDFDMMSYKEVRDFRVQRNPEPYRCSQTLIYHFQDKKWWIKVTVEGVVPCFPHDTEPEKTKTSRQRRKEFQAFTSLIDFQLLKLLDNTVTEIILEEDGDPQTTEPLKLHREPEDTNGFAKLSRSLRFYIQEDPSRVIYPPRLQFPSFRAIDVAELVEEDEISDGVFRVLHKGDKVQYILKAINRSIYLPSDSDVIQQELENLKRFKGTAGIVQSAGIAVFTNPYATSQKGAEQIVINGILLEYHSGGSLQHILKEQRVREFGWERWAVQIGNALGNMHRENLTHMDLKPSNIVLGIDGNTVLIDISGIGGTTHEWRAPEIWGEISPLELPFQARRLNDVWAYGKLLAEIASHAGDSPYARILKSVAGHITEDVHNRWTLSEGISQLKECQYVD
jgi:hypothetical protein